MKKMLAATLFTLMSTTAIAAVTNNSITTANMALKKGSTFEWRIDDSIPLVVVDNLAASHMKLLVRVDSGDKVSALCGGQADELGRGTAIICELSPGANLQLIVLRDNFHGGAKGTYTFVK